LKWYDIFIPIVNKHAPIRTKRVKHATLPKWLSPEIKDAMKIRDTLKKEKKNCKIQITKKSS
jgi:hypothetical protein